MLKVIAYRKAIADAFPEIQFDEAWVKGWLIFFFILCFIFTHCLNVFLLEWHTRGFWKDRENRRQFLIDLAKSKGLDPFDPQTWTTITHNDVRASKVTESLPIFHITLNCICRDVIC
jgi:hypothetical protein